MRATALRCTWWTTVPQSAVHCRTETYVNQILVISFAYPRLRYQHPSPTVLSNLHMYNIIRTELQIIMAPRTQVVMPTPHSPHIRVVYM